MGLVFIFLGVLGGVFGFGWVNLCGDKKIGIELMVFSGNTVKANKVP